jgi:hypothetical protein
MDNKNKVSSIFAVQHRNSESGNWEDVTNKPLTAEQAFKELYRLSVNDPANYRISPPGLKD